nr:hypothetical protein [Verminephrobacter eiseniae]
MPGLRCASDAPFHEITDCWATPGIDQHMLAGDAVAVIAGEKERRPRNMARVEADLQALRVEEHLVGCGIPVQGGLPLGDDRSRHDRVDADVARAQFARERAGQAEDAGLRSGVANQAQLSSTSRRAILLA